MKRYTKWPTPEKSYNSVLEVIKAFQREGLGGLDLEYSPSGPTIIGVASLDRCAAWTWSAALGHAVLEANVPLAAHAGIGADKPVIERALGVTTPLELWHDTMIKHYIVNPDLASIPKNISGEDRDDVGIVLGLMNLWATTSMLHDVPNWKQCAGQEACIRERRPCPTHDEPAYCAVDAWAGLVDDYSLDEQMRELAIPQSYYWFRAALQLYCDKMQKRGILTKPEVIAELEEAIRSRKADLFPSHLNWLGKMRKNGTQAKLKKPKVIWDGPFNPASPKAALQYFESQGIALRGKGGKPSIGKQVILKTLEKQLKPYGATFNVYEGELEGEEEITLPEPVDILLRLVQRTCGGKGTKSWFDPAYLTNNELHSRFNACGSIFGRLSSSKSNLQNVARIDFLARSRNAIIPRPGLQLVSADASQLEFRICLWAAGLDPNLADGAFELLVDASNGAFEETAKRLNWKPRDVAKSMIHGGNYCEGIQVKTAAELSSSTILGDRKAGALMVYDGKDLPEWKFRDGFVCFSGVNVAERIFGDKTRSSRAKALSLQKVYLDAFPQIRQFQQKVSREVEQSNEVRLPSGHRVPLYGRSPEDDLKQAVACWGQGCGAIYIQEAMLLFDKQGEVMLLQVHDDCVFEKPIDWKDETYADFMRPMVQMSTILPGFSCPAKVKVGPNWGEMREIGTIRL